MNKREWLILIAVLLVFQAGFIWQYEKYIHNQTKQLTKQYSVFLSPYLWNYDKKNTRDSLRIITELRSFKSAQVLHPNGTTFVRVRHNQPESVLGTILKKLNLIHTIQFSHPVRHNGNKIATLKIDWVNRAIYMHIYAGLVLILFGAIIYFYRASRSREREIQRLRLKQERKAREEAEASERAKSDFLAKMSHELRTPLTAIIGYSEMLYEQYDHYDTAQIKSDLEKIQAAGNHLHDLINNILDLSKIEAGKAELNLEEFTLQKLCEDVIDTLRPLASKNNNELSTDWPTEPVTMQADRTKVRQCLFNLLSNACKYTDNGEVELVVEPVSRDGLEGVRIEVTDTGPGMTDEQIETIFESFEQSELPSGRSVEGTGLGLTITQKFCDMMNGILSVSSEPGTGSTFSIWLPRRVEPET